MAVAFAVVGGMAWVAAARVGDLAADEHRVVNLREAFLLADVQVAFLRGQAYENAVLPVVPQLRFTVFTSVLFMVQVVPLWVTSM